MLGWNVTVRVEMYYLTIVLTMLVKEVSLPPWRAEDRQQKMGDRQKA